MPRDLYSSGSDEGDTDQEVTPRRKPGAPALRKRMSGIFNSSNDDDGNASFGSPSGRAPLQSLNINDDAAEKRRRRKSMKAKTVDELEAGPSTEETSNKPRRLLNSATQIPKLNLPKELMNSNYEEWMKLATDNKINAANSWNFALIDYFHDMSLLRNNTDNSINFQRASCTLDGCVKIWVSRVDSIGTETGRLLSNLTTGGEEAELGSENEGDGIDADGIGTGKDKKKKKSGAKEATLAKNIAQLRNKKLELEFSVDPLFKKTCADFDEGGAHGLLMNHLALGVGSDGGMRVVFDAGDSVGKSTENDEVDDLEPPEKVNLSHLRKHFFPDLSVLADKAISHSLASFSFSKDASFTFDDSTFYQENTQTAWAEGLIEEDMNSEASHGASAAPPGMDDGLQNNLAEDFFTGDQAVDNDYANADDFENDFDDTVTHAHNADAAEQPTGISNVIMPFDPRKPPHQRNLVLAIGTGDHDEDGMLDYFDAGALQNWAGPQHWKIRRIAKRPEGLEIAAKVKKEKKEPFKIDFDSPPAKDLKTLTKELFAPVTRGTINMPCISGRRKKISPEKKDINCLPDDIHFSARQLVTLFLKPEFALRMRGQRKFDELDSGQVDENFWTKAAADQAAGRQSGVDADESAIPFNTQFLHDDDFDDAGGGFEDGFEGAVVTGPAIEEEDEDLLAATSGQTRRIRLEFVNYAKRAKRVDVRRLKENIWKGLNIVPSGIAEKGEEDAAMEDNREATDPNESRVFSSVINNLQKQYPADKMSEISTSFCFICLLHLANEQGLKIASEDAVLVSDDSSSLQTADIRVGNLGDLKVYRDPTASKAA